jgi:sugar porter (SP) family MFS transporter
MPRHTRNALLYSMIIALGGFVFGFDASVISGVVVYVTRKFSLDPIQQGLVVSAPTLAAIFASLTVGPLADFVGRKRVLQFLALLYTVSAVFSALADSFRDLVIARAIGGYAFGSLVLAPIYIAELSPARLRGRFVAINQFTIVVGLSTAYFVNYYIQSVAASGAAWVSALSIDKNTWNWMLGVETVPAFLWLVLLTFVPRSPRWLGANGHWDEAEKVLAKIVDPNTINAAVEEIRSAVGGVKTTLADRLSELFSRKMVFILTIGIIVAIVQQITGINIVFFYATTIFEQSGVGTNAAFAQAVSVGVVNVIFTIIAMATIDSLGRKPLLIIGLVGVAVSMAVVSWGFHQARYEIDSEAIAQLEAAVDREQLSAIEGIEYKNDVAFKKAVRGAIGETALRDNEAAILKAAMSADSRLILLGILGFVASFAISLGPVMWVLLSEIFPVKIRGVAISLVTIFNSGASWLVQFLFPWEVATFGAAGVFLSFSLFAVIGLVLIAWLLPETKGLSLEQLERKLASRGAAAS